VITQLDTLPLEIFYTSTHMCVNKKKPSALFRHCPTSPRMGSQADNAGDEQTHARLPSSYWVETGSVWNRCRL